MEKKTLITTVHIKELTQNFVPRIFHAIAIKMALRANVVRPMGIFVAK
jgi:hypothetical protein